MSTAEDYAQFATMNAGQMGMSPRGIGFGLGVQVVEDSVAADRRVSKGAWGWAGAYGTNVHIEPQEKMVTIILMQTSTPALQRDFENAVFQALIPCPVAGRSVRNRTKHL